MSRSTTRKLLCASRAAAARPTPCAAPVTTTVFKSNLLVSPAPAGIRRDHQGAVVHRRRNVDRQPRRRTDQRKTRADEKGREPQVLAREIRDDGNADQSAEIAAGVHEAADD